MTELEFLRKLLAEATPGKVLLDETNADFRLMAVMHNVAQAVVNVLRATNNGHCLHCGRDDGSHMDFCTIGGLLTAIRSQMPKEDRP